MEKIKVLMVCMGNICRSPLAHGLFEHQIREAGLGERVHVDSAGTHAYHVGEPPDPRSQETARGHGIDLSVQRARQVVAEDIVEYDYVLAMDEDNLMILQDLCPPGHEHKIRLFMEFAPDVGQRVVPDPYYGGPSGFDRVFDLVEAAAAGLLEEIRTRC